ncbi:hypothetical protein MKX03_022324, partial [Papaver bracteatum]
MNWKQEKEPTLYPNFHIFESTFVQKRIVVKVRFSKKYRHQIDSKNLPGIVMHALTFEFVEGPAAKDVFSNFGLNHVTHGGLIHGDLTTSNMLLQSDNSQLILIDFGLSFLSSLTEVKVVDLYIIERDLTSMHSSCGTVMDHILSGYRKSSAMVIFCFDPFQATVFKKSILNKLEENHGTY